MFYSIHRLLGIVQTVSEAIPILGNDSKVVVSYSTFSVSVQEVQPENFTGQTISVLLETEFDYETDEETTVADLVYDESPEAAASLTLPDSLFSSLATMGSFTNTNTSTRIIHAAFLTNSLFLRRMEDHQLEVGGIIISAAISGNVAVKGLDHPIKLRFTKLLVS